mgnify:CR=1 FL=1
MLGAFITAVYVLRAVKMIFLGPPDPRIQEMEDAQGVEWVTLVVLGGLLIVFVGAASLVLPRQFHVTVVENRSENEIRRARWLLPLYLVLINLFVVPIAAAGLIPPWGAAIGMSLSSLLVVMNALRLQRAGVTFAREGQNEKCSPIPSK